MRTILSGLYFAFTFAVAPAFAQGNITSILQTTAEISEGLNRYTAEAVAESPMIMSPQVSELAAGQARLMAQVSAAHDHSLINEEDCPEHRVRTGTGPTLRYVSVYGDRELGAARARLGSESFLDLMNLAAAENRATCPPQHAIEMRQLWQNNSGEPYPLQNLPEMLQATQRRLVGLCSVQVPAQSLIPHVLLRRWQVNPGLVDEDLRALSTQLSFQQKIELTKEMMQFLSQMARRTQGRNSTPNSALANLTQALSSTGSVASPDFTLAAAQMFSRLQSGNEEVVFVRGVQTPQGRQDFLMFRGQEQSASGRSADVFVFTPLPNTGSANREPNLTEVVTAENQTVRNPEAGGLLAAFLTRARSQPDLTMTSLMTNGPDCEGGCQMREGAFRGSDGEQRRVTAVASDFVRSRTQQQQAATAQSNGAKGGAVAGPQQGTPNGRGVQILDVSSGRTTVNVLSSGLNVQRPRELNPLQRLDAEQQALQNPRARQNLTQEPRLAPTSVTGNFTYDLAPDSSSVSLLSGTTVVQTSVDENGNPTTNYLAEGSFTRAGTGGGGAISIAGGRDDDSNFFNAQAGFAAGSLYQGNQTGANDGIALRADFLSRDGNTRTSLEGNAVVTTGDLTVNAQGQYVVENTRMAANTASGKGGETVTSGGGRQAQVQTQVDVNYRASDSDQLQGSFRQTDGRSAMGAQTERAYTVGWQHSGELSYSLQGERVTSAGPQGSTSRMTVNAQVSGSRDRSSWSGQAQYQRTITSTPGMEERSASERYSVGGNYRNQVVDELGGTELSYSVRGAVVVERTPTGETYYIAEGGGQAEFASGHSVTADFSRVIASSALTPGYGLLQQPQSRNRYRINYSPVPDGSIRFEAGNQGAFLTLRHEIQPRR